jgi:hypothetical protein
MPDPTLQQIKEEMRIAIIFYPVQAYSLFGELSVIDKIKDFFTLELPFPTYFMRITYTLII